MDIITQFLNKDLAFGKILFVVHEKIVLGGFVPKDDAELDSCMMQNFTDKTTLKTTYRIFKDCIMYIEYRIFKDSSEFLKIQNF